MGVALTDKAEKYVILVRNKDKETKQEFPTREEAMAFLPKVLELKRKAIHLKVKLRLDFGDGHLYAPHNSQVLFDKSDRMILEHPSKRPMRDFRADVRWLIKKGVLYCPECGFGTRYKYDSETGNSCCEMCGISENDFYVRSCNNLWPTFKKESK
jgi:hypothetical protein